MASSKQQADREFIHMGIQYISSSDDPSIAPFHLLKDSVLQNQHGLFAVEGLFLVQRLLESIYQPYAILLEESRLQELAGSIPANSQVFIASKKVISQIAGFDFHRGVIALGMRQSLPDIRNFTNFDDRLLFAICPEINDVENLGSIMRNAAAFAVDAVLMGPSCCDPFARRSLRASMGAVLKLALYSSRNLENDLRWLKEQQDFRFYATVLDENAVSLNQARRPHRLGILFGREAIGLEPEWLSFCDTLLTIPMQEGVDSLNVGVAAGIVFYHFTQIERG